MNDGFFSLIAIWCLLIVVWSGWLDKFLEAEKLSKRGTFLFLLVSLVGGGWTLSFASGEVRPVPFFLPLFFASWLWIKQEDKERMRLVAASLLIGASIVLTRLLFQLDPILLIIDEKRLLAFFLVVLALAMTRRFKRQWILLVFGLAFSEIGFQLIVWEKSFWISLGSAFFQDVWWIALYSLGFSRLLIAMFSRSIMPRGKRERSAGIARMEEIK